MIDFFQQQKTVTENWDQNNILLNLHLTSQDVKVCD